ncbi:NmrA family transcriptional regulator [Serinibacter arcticus]|uniref:NmrA family transcriptional regulator n=1 Tax=Serinibacter arcticus TaxID=1655435 RepID=A0A2U1ZWN7_9MICO|nr:NmrA family NAD(P)-binding protein [Serinibacter arcticus]PWD51399.1 NmrA family transcriptional regulator [Serinibacter arcticus]
MSTPSPSSPTVLVTGATGKTGRRVVPLLRAREAAVREGSRRTEPPFDWDDAGTWGAALAGVDVVYVVMPDLGDGAAVERTAAFARQAAAAGVGRAVLVSVPAGGGMDDGVVAATEDGFTDAGLAPTVLRLRSFFQNFTEDFFADAVAEGVLRVPAGQGREAFVDADDIAAVAVEALLDPTHAGRSYEITGPQAFSFADLASTISEQTGRATTYEALSPEEYVDDQVCHGVPVELAELLGGLYEQIAAGALDSVSGDVEAVLGRPPRTFAAFARAEMAPVVA